MRTVTAITTAAVLLALSACERAGEPDLESMEVTRTYSPALNVDLEQMTRHESGLYIQDLRVGEGELVETGDAILVHYTGWLTDGTQFDSSHNRGVPLDIAIGTGQVIRGWDEGVPGMRVGGRRRLVIPPGLAYGAGGAGGVIPPGATLVFDIELIDIVRPDM